MVIFSFTPIYPARSDAGRQTVVLDRLPKLRLETGVNTVAAYQEHQIVPKFKHILRGRECVLMRETQGQAVLCGGWRSGFLPRTHRT